MTTTDIETRVAALLRGLAREAGAPVTSETRIREDLGLTSFDVLELRDGLERSFGIRLADRDVVRLGTVASIGQLIAENTAPTPVPAAPPPSAATEPSTARTGFGGSWLGPQRELRTEIEVGMPLTGVNELAESPLLKELGDLRWKHVARVTGIPSRDIADDEGDRLYATFFFVDVSFPEATPMASVGENDRFEVVSTLRRYGSSLVDGEHWLYPADSPAEERVAPPAPDEALRERVPCVRLANIYVKQWDGASWLRQSRPAQAEFQSIRKVDTAPDASAWTARAKEGEDLLETPSGWTPLNPEPLRYEYTIVPDRDLNGAGLLYFANYPVFLDLAERAALESENWWRLDAESVDRRTLVRRRSAYFSNATRDDALIIESRGFVRNPFELGDQEPELSALRMLWHFRMRRRSDDRLMMVSSAEKVFPGVTVGHTGMVEGLRAPRRG